MATCVDIQLPSPQLPTIPGFNPPTNITFPPAGTLGIPCCQITIVGLNIPLPTPLDFLLAEIAGANVAITSVNAAITAFIASLTALSLPTCPKNGTTVNPYQ